MTLSSWSHWMLWWWLPRQDPDFGGLLYETILSGHACCLNIKISQNFKCLRNKDHNKVLWRTGLTQCYKPYISYEYIVLISVQAKKIGSSASFLLWLRYLDTLTINSNLKTQIDKFGIKCLCRILGVSLQLSCLTSAITPWVNKDLLLA